MKILRKWKRAAAIGMTAALLSCSFTVPVLAHGHGGGHHGAACDGTGNASRVCGASGNVICRSQKGVYCPYHETYHKKKSACKRYCKKHKTIHSNGKRHHAARHH